MNKIISLIVTVAVAISVAPAFAKPDVDHSVIVPLGEAFDRQTGKKVEGFKIIHYKRGYHHRPNHTGGPGGEAGSTCYAYLSKGANWKLTEDYLVDSSNTQGLASSSVHSLLSTALETWDSEVAADIFGVESIGVVDGADFIAPDGKNEFLFANVSDPGAIAVTIVWGIFSGPPFQRELVEWDMVFDDVDFSWSVDASGVAGKMDFLNIAVHEVGHAAGMGHPSDSCVEETMFRFASEGEIKKRDLNAGDIAGIKALY
ncbi:MAG: matrixin family metalloprotease [Candidatus Harrisonbacteria bacterium]|nr:matrixin family metalloprotease [Candidatus Harrisonbacteria bacterium]